VSHLEPDRLVLLALGEAPADAGETGHLDGCEGCRTEVADLRTVAGIGRETQDVRDLPAPPEHVWHMINADVGTAETKPRPGLRRRRGPIWRATAVIAAATALFAVVLVVFLVRRESATQAACTLGTFRLTPLAGAPGGVSATACLVDDEGERKLHIAASGLPTVTDGFYEVWLIDPSSLRTPSTVRMVTVGSLGTRPTEDFPLPPSLDLRRYSLVDVSAEPDDGNAAHSGHSLLRGTLVASMPGKTPGTTPGR
jgi:anti-sigma-K factor RskA